MRKLLVVLLIFPFVRAVGQVTTTQLDEQHLLRRIRLGQRELHLPQQLENDELTVTNDKLDVKIANLEKIEPDTNRVRIDQFVADQTKAAIRDAMVFAQMYHLSSSPVQLLVDLDMKFDAADARCHALGADEQRAVFGSMLDAHSACADLMAISSAVSSLHIAIPQTWPSVFKEDAEYRTRIGYKFLLADTKQLRRDQDSHIDPKAKRLLVTSDRTFLLDDKQIWLTEMSEQETVEFNAKHPEHEMGDMSEILAMFKQSRAERIKIVGKFRVDIQQLSKR